MREETDTGYEPQEIQQRVQTRISGAGSDERENGQRSGVGAWAGRSMVDPLVVLRQVDIGGELGIESSGNWLIEKG